MGVAVVVETHVVTEFVREGRAAATEHGGAERIARERSADVLHEVGNPAVLAAAYAPHRSTR